MPATRVAAVAMLAVVAFAACSDDDDDAAPASSTSGSSGAAAAVPATPAAGGSVAALPLPPSTPPTATQPPPADLDELAAGLLGSDEIGLPASWTIRDVDPAIMDDDMAALSDPLQSLATCPDGALRPAAGWLQRTFSGAEPLDTGMLRVDLILAVEGAHAFAARRAELAGCTAGEESFAEASEVMLAPLDGEPLAAVGPEIPATALVLSIGPTAEVAYPSSYAVVTANLDGHTVTAVVGGVDLGVPFDATTRQLVGRVLARL